MYQRTDAAMWAAEQSHLCGYANVVCLRPAYEVEPVGIPTCSLSPMSVKTQGAGPRTPPRLLPTRKPVLAHGPMGLDKAELLIS